MKYLFGFWLGISMGIVGFHWFSWQYWFVILPTMILALSFRK